MQGRRVGAGSVAPGTGIHRLSLPTLRTPGSRWSEPGVHRYQVRQSPARGGPQDTGQGEVAAPSLHSRFAGS